MGGKVANRRRASIPFSLGSKNIRTLKDIQEILKSHPEDLILPAKDGRLKRFLQGFGKTYADCLDPDNIQESIQKLAGIFGIEIKDVDFSLDSNIATDNSKVIELLEKGETGAIEISKGVFVFDRLYIDKPVKIVGQGKSETLIRANIVCVTCEGFAIENLTFECNHLITDDNLSFEKDKAKLEYKKRYSFKDVVEIIKRELHFYENKEKIKTSILRLERKIDEVKNELSAQLKEILNRAEENIKDDILWRIESMWWGIKNVKDYIIEYGVFFTIKGNLYYISENSQLQALDKKFDEFINAEFKTLEKELTIYLKDIYTSNLIRANLDTPNDFYSGFKGFLKDIMNKVKIDRSIRSILQKIMDDAEDPMYYNELKYNEFNNEIKNKIMKIAQECKYTNGLYSKRCLEKVLTWQQLQHIIREYLSGIYKAYLYTLNSFQQKFIDITKQEINKYLNTVEKQKINEYLNTVGKAIHDLPKKKLCDLLKIKGDELGVYVQK